MKAGRPRTIADCPCAFCAQVFHPKHATQRFCSRQCRDQGQRIVAAPPPMPSPRRRRYAYTGRLSDELQREVAAARAEAATAPLYRPGGVL